MTFRRLLVAIVVLIGLCYAVQQAIHQPLPPIKIGVLHSLTGTMAISERPLVNSVRLAVNEINARGGLLGRRIEMLIADGRSDPAVFAKEARRLITQEKVSVLFGCWTSAARKAVKPVVEQYQHLLFYPLQYEGLEESAHIIYTGSAPNQQIIPATRWALDNLGKRVYLLGSNYIFPRTANIIIRDLVKSVRGQVLAEHYLPLGSRDVAAVIDDIERLKPDVIINTINGDSALYFLHAFQASAAKQIPVLSLSMTEVELSNHPDLALAQHYAAWSYFQSIATANNQRFIAAYQQLDNGLANTAHSVTNDPIEAAYFGVQLWALAVREANSVTPQRVNKTIGRQSFSAPSGIISIDAVSRHTWKMLRIGKALANGQFVEVYRSLYPLRPEPFPTYRLASEWQSVMTTLSKE